MEKRFVKETGYLPTLHKTWPLWLLGAFALLASLSGMTPALRYERVAVLAGEWWRLVTGQFVHLGVSHLAMNLAGLAVIGWVFAPGLRAGAWLIVLAGSWLAIAAGFVLLEPRLAWYVGLSGLLHGLLLGAALVDRGYPVSIRAGVIGVTLAKLAWEQWAGALPFTAEAAGGPVVVDAHLYGGLGGLLAAVPLWLHARRRPV